MFKNIITVLVFVIISIKVNSQCAVTAYVNAGTGTLEICQGDSVTLTATGSCPNYLLYDDFNIGAPGTGWSSGSQAMFNNPCAPHSPDGTIYLWMGELSPAPRNLTTVNLDVSTGGTIQFEMRYSVQSASSPCEGPDEYDEGIAVQYSIDSGSTWITIEYYAPNGNVLNYIPTASTPGATGQTPFTVWTTKSVPIPPAAMTASTMFRWVQTASTSEVYDHWGLDNVSFLGLSPTISMWWSDGTTGFNQHTVWPLNDTTYTVYISDGIDTVQDSVNIIVNPIPTSSFTVVSPIYEDSITTVIYTGSAAVNAYYAWQFQGGIIQSGSGVGPFQVSYSNAGTYDIKLSVLENGCPSLQTTIPVVVNSLSGISSLVAAKPLAIFPNPNNGTFSIDGAGTVSIYNVIGECITSKEINGNTSFQLSCGIYMVKFIDRHNSSTIQKVVIQK